MNLLSLFICLVFSATNTFKTKNEKSPQTNNTSTTNGNKSNRPPNQDNTENYQKKTAKYETTNLIW